MIIQKSAPILLIATVAFNSNVMANDIAIYRWLDENNIVHFSQHQPQGDNFSQLTTIASYKARTKDRVSEYKRPSVDEQISRHEKEQAEVAIKNKDIALKNCKAAQLNVQMLNSSNKVSITDLDGKNRELTDKEKKAQLALSHKHIDLYCEKTVQNNK